MNIINSISSKLPIAIGIAGLALFSYFNSSAPQQEDGQNNSQIQIKSETEFQECIQKAIQFQPDEDTSSKLSEQLKEKTHLEVIEDFKKYKCVFKKWQSQINSIHPSNQKIKDSRFVLFVMNIGVEKAKNASEPQTPTHHYYIAKNPNSDEIEGVMSLRVSSKYPEVVIDTMTTAPKNILNTSCKVKGVGTSFLAEATKIALLNGKNKLVVKPLESSVSFYKKLGFIDQQNGSMHLNL